MTIPVFKPYEFASIEKNLIEYRNSELEKTTTKYPQKVVTILEFINENIFDQDLSITKARSVCRLQDKNLSSSFRFYLGLTPSGYISHHRIRAATQLLKLKEVNITFVSILVGYQSSSAFAKQFRKTHQISPSEYVREMQNR